MTPTCDLNLIGCIILIYDSDHNKSKVIYLQVGLQKAKDKDDVSEHAHIIFEMNYAPAEHDTVDTA